MTPQEILKEAETHFAAIRDAAQRGAITWKSSHSPDESTAYDGFTPAYTIVVIKAGTIVDGAITTATGAFNIIRLTPEMAKLCFENAEKILHGRD